MTQLAVVGATGRMGRCVLELASVDQRFEVVAALCRGDDPLCGKSLRIGEGDYPVSNRLATACDVMIDFTTEGGTAAWLKSCLALSIPMVIGGTDHSDDDLGRISEAARSIPILKADNFSVGITALMDMVGRMARQLGEAYDIEIVETHHRGKADAPSGTARALVDRLQAEEKRLKVTDVVFGREGMTGPRPANQIAVHAVRMGGVIGQHEIHFASTEETVTLRHCAHSRKAFAAGALRGAAWIVGKKPGLYSMADVLGFDAQSGAG